ncbi:hypothetical protein [Aestuariicoccus sp. MJ-SS9]|uniref:hypothetical protein n=1 Tax=Aestuariicoccus sp. MJ-SS9 TaxID=3079855 RepID=UPI00291323AA|nr:hypothetical protein [Aestuariicoccus sp. MJ-SS9]MDU8914001.1 hypothetical protein [Aestuariicoccus sp. MJ-SS9]
MVWTPDWSPQIEAIATRQPIDTILHVGFCGEDELGALISAQAQRVVLVEPDPDHAGMLADRSAEHEHVDVISAALGVRGGKAAFLRLSLPEFSDIDMPEDLMTLYPGLRITARLETRVMDVPTLLQEARIKPPQAGMTHLLILDSPVSAAKHTALFLEGSALQDFDRILLQASRDDLGGVPANALLSRLTEAGFLTEGIMNSDPNFLRASLFYPARLREAEAAVAHLETMQARLEELQKKNATLSETEERARRELSRIQETAARIPEMESRLEALQQTNVALSEAEENTRRDLRLALRMQAMLERDIAELRDRFSALQDAKSAQDMLLAQMASPLERALEAVSKTPSAKRKKS